MKKKQTWVVVYRVNPARNTLTDGASAIGFVRNGETTAYYTSARAARLRAKQMGKDFPDCHYLAIKYE